jgi:hypothetical protein
MPGKKLMTFQTVVWILVGISMVLIVIAQMLRRRSKPPRRQRSKHASDPRMAVAWTEPSLSPSESDDRSPPIIEFDSFARTATSDDREDYEVDDLSRREQSVFSQDSFELIDAGATSVKSTENTEAFSENESLRGAAHHPADESTTWILEFSSAIGNLDESARLAFVPVLESAGTSRAVIAIANAAAQDPAISIRVEALRALARLVEVDGELRAACAAAAARTVIAQREKGGEDVLRARDLLATVDVVQFEAQACESQ